MPPSIRRLLVVATALLPLAAPARRAAALTRGLAAMGDKAGARASRGGDVAIDFDVVTKSHGNEVKYYALTVTGRDANRATVVATIDPGDWLRQSARENVVTFSLLRQAGRWRVDDVSGVAEPTSTATASATAASISPCCAASSSATAGRTKRPSPATQSASRRRRRRRRGVRNRSRRSGRSLDQVRKRTSSARPTKTEEAES